jgi:DNA repair exonuclease SbcCD ATPase subunit
MIKFTKIRYKNLLSTGNQWTEIDLAKDPTTLIVGTNGAGKSTMIDALQFCWFGKPYRKINKNQLINSITRKECVVEGEALIGAKHIRVVRGIKPAVFEIYENGELVDQSAASKDYQEYLEKQVLQLTPRAFSQIVVLGSANYVPFMQLTTSQRRELIEDLLDLKVFTSMNSLLKTRVDENNKTITDLENELKLLQTKKRMTESHLKEMETNNELLISEKQERIDLAQVELGTLIEDHKVFVAIETDLAQALKDVKALSSEAVNKIKNELRAKVDQAKAVSVAAEETKLKKLSSLEAELKAKVSLLTKDKQFLEKNDHCPTCKQEIAGDFKSLHVQEKQTKIDEIVTSLPKLSEEKERLMAVIVARAEAIGKAESEYNDEVRETEASAELSVRGIETELTKQRGRVSNKAVEVRSKTSYIKELESEIKSLQNRKPVTPETESIDTINTQIGINEFDIDEAKKTRELLLVGSSFLKDTGIKSQIVKQYVPIINKIVNKYLSAMDFFVDFRFDENFNETIKSRFRDEFTYASFSEGEKMKLDLSILFTWRAIAKLRNSMTTNLTIFDEIMDSSLDLNGTDEFLKIIKAAEGVNTFVISHRTDTIIDKFDSILTFAKNQNFSSLVEE